MTASGSGSGSGVTAGEGRVRLRCQQGATAVGADDKILQVARVAQVVLACPTRTPSSQVVDATVAEGARISRARKGVRLRNRWNRTSSRAGRSRPRPSASAPSSLVRLNPVREPSVHADSKVNPRHSTLNGVVLKYAEPPEARKPVRNWRLYVFKGKEQVGTSRSPRVLPVYRTGSHRTAFQICSTCIDSLHT